MVDMLLRKKRYGSLTKHITSSSFLYPISRKPKIAVSKAFPPTSEFTPLIPNDISSSSTDSYRTDHNQNNSRQVLQRSPSYFGGGFSHGFIKQAVLIRACHVLNALPD